MTNTNNDEADHIRLGKQIIDHLEKKPFPIALDDLLTKVGIDFNRFKVIARTHYGTILLYNKEKITGFGSGYKNLDHFKDAFGDMEKRSRGRWRGKESE